MKRPEIGPGTTALMNARIQELIRQFAAEKWTVKQACFILLRAASQIGFSGGLSASHLAQMPARFYAEFAKRRN